MATLKTADELKSIFQEGWNIPERVENYSRGVKEFTEGPTHVAWRDTLAAAAGGTAPLDVLDVGTGPGIYACLYAQMGHRAVGLDFSERMLTVARQRKAELQLDCEFLMGDAEAPPFDAESFDVVSSRHVLFTLPRPGVAIREWVRVLKPGGRLILMGNDHDESPNTPPRRRATQLWNQLRRRFTKRPARRWSPATGYTDALAQCPLRRHGSLTLRAVMEAAGLDDIHLHPTDSIEQARRQSPTSKTRQFVAAGKFFILVGRKP
ncbi:class I SAM-dependent methyltransferase [Aeoliella mucimassa]|uniref:Demethylmenaquinone methyltransferase n=1 Tax=Aeoliella mucimassa TaxID=2527972 RepID=A0A518AW87_9BACT|nr:class I SAM-dependent methyltransferase [Aeoliella mucimassa]QDU58970.1 Demethylmenaquinone methyltransferase [Aeoliella mucimassa]